MSQKRYLGLDLSGAKNAKTTLAVLEYYPKEKKVFLLDIHSGIGTETHFNSDEALIQTIGDHADNHPEVQIGVNAPLTLPPFFALTKKNRNPGDLFSTPELKWMAANTPKKTTTSKRNARLKDFFTPYTQRPIELWLKNQVMSKLPPKIRFEIDETLGSNKAPLTARMQFLKMYLGDYKLHEVVPKLTVALLMPFLKLKHKTLLDYRKLDEGLAARQVILDRMSENLDIFIYERDFKKITQNLNAFDAFLCAFTVLLYDRNECVSPPKNFPVGSGWVRYPKSPLLDSSNSSSPDDFGGEDEE